MGQSTMARPSDVKSFTYAADDPLADEHAAVSAWVEDAVGRRAAQLHYPVVELETFPSGQTLLD